MSIEPVMDYLRSLPLHDRETLLHILEVADKAMLLDCSERKIFDGLKLSLWKSIKIEEIR